MAEDMTVWVSTNMDIETKRRLEKMSAAEDRSMAWIIRSLINAEWEKRNTVSAETLPAVQTPEGN